jgi:hypothetical protein
LGFGPKSARVGHSDQSVQEGRTDLDADAADQRPTLAAQTRGHNHGGFSGKWVAYERLQKQLVSRTSVDARSWGIEDGLDALCKGQGLSKAIKTVAAGRRRENHRARARAGGLIEELGPCPEATLIARDQLRNLRRSVGEPGWRILIGLAVGETYDELSKQEGPSSAALRVYVTRTRAKFQAYRTAA